MTIAASPLNIACPAACRLPTARRPLFRRCSGALRGTAAEGLYLPTRLLDIWCGEACSKETSQSHQLAKIVLSMQTGDRTVGFHL